MDDVDQLVSAIMVIVFAALMLVVGQLYMEHRAQKPPPIPTAQMGSMKTLPL